MKTIIVQVTNDWIFLNEEYAVQIEHTNIPYKYLAFNENRIIFWEAEMLSFSKDKQELTLRVIDFFPSDVSTFGSQNPKYIVRRLTFEPMNWNGFQGHLTSYSKKNIEHFITDRKARKKVLEKFEKSIRISIDKINFNLGYVSFLDNEKWSRGTQETVMSLPESIPEYNYIKGYFTKILGRKTIDVVSKKVMFW